MFRLMPVLQSLVRCGDFELFGKPGQVEFHQGVVRLVDEAAECVAHENDPKASINAAARRSQDANVCFPRG